MAILSKKQPINPVAKHQAISDDAFSLFTATIDKLNAADDGIQSDIDSAQAKIDAAANEKSQLEAIRKRNADLNAKISKFFS
jgi:ABC-type transporter Mla subunit MlaD